MSALLQGVPFHRPGTGGIYITDGTLAPSNYANGLPYDLIDDLAVDTVSAIDHYHQGLPFTAAGRLAVEAPGVPVRYGSGAAPFAASGRLALEESTTDHYSSGVGYTATGAVNVAPVK